MVSRKDTVAKVLGIDSPTPWLQAVRLSDLPKYTAFEVRLQIPDYPYTAVATFRQLAEAMQKLGLRFVDCTPAELLAAKIEPGRWGLDTRLAGSLQRALLSMWVVTSMTDQQLEDIPQITSRRIPQIRAAQARFERGER